MIPSRVAFNDYQVSSQTIKDSVIVQMLQPYQDSVHKAMFAIVGYAEKTLERAQPEGTLGNFVVNAIYTGAKKKYGQPVDIAIQNDGGIRADYLAAGNVNRWNIYNIMPFDNLLVLQQIRGDVLQQYLNLIAANKGWPVAGLTMQIKNKKATHILINGQPLDPAKTYTVAHADYLANGGENASFLRQIPQ